MKLFRNFLEYACIYITLRKVAWKKLIGKGTHGFRQRRSLIYKAHDGTRDFPCFKCDRDFINPNQLRVHYLRKHAEPSERRFECIFCTKTFVNAAEMDGHLRSHVGEKPFFCNLCDNSYLDGAGLSKHMRCVHN